MPFPNPLKEKWSQDVATVGPFVQLPAAGIPEILALAGFDFCIIDLEHGPINIETAENMVRAADASGLVPLVRVQSNAKELITEALSIGAGGVHVPHVSTKEEAEAAVHAAKFVTPEFSAGNRGVCPFVRSAGYSSKRTGNYYDRANKETIIVVAIEGKEGLANLGEILTVEGLDAVFVGPYDLSQSLGVTGQVTHPLVIQKIRDLCRQGKKAGIAVGLFIESAEDAKKWIDEGVLYCCVDVDSAIFYKAAKKLVDGIKKVEVPPVR